MPFQPISPPWQEPRTRCLQVHIYIWLGSRAAHQQSPPGHHKDLTRRTDCKYIFRTITHYSSQGCVCPQTKDMEGKSIIPSGNVNSTWNTDPWLAWADNPCGRLPGEQADELSRCCPDFYFGFCSIIRRKKQYREQLPYCRVLFLYTGVKTSTVLDTALMALAEAWRCPAGNKANPSSMCWSCCLLCSNRPIDFYQEGWHHKQ